MKICYLVFITILLIAQALAEGDVGGSNFLGKGRGTKSRRKKSKSCS